MSKTNGRKAQPKKGAARPPRSRGLSGNDLMDLCGATGISPEDAMRSSLSARNPHTIILANLLAGLNKDELARKATPYLIDKEAFKVLRDMAASVRNSKIDRLLDKALDAHKEEIELMALAKIMHT